MDPVKFGAFPPISVIQFEPFFPGQVETGSNQCIIHDEEFEVNRVLIDGLARVTSVQGVRERLQVENPEAYKILDSFRFSVALYVPTETPVGPAIAGQLFTDFNSYDWPVSSAKALADDSYNPYKVIAHIVGNPTPSAGTAGSKAAHQTSVERTHFTTELAMSQFCKIAIEGRRGYGKLTKPVSNAKISGTGMATLDWLIACCRRACNVLLTQAA
jgi:hypothetical protein